MDGLSDGGGALHLGHKAQFRGWDRIAAQPERVQVPEWHHRVIDERLQDLADNPGDESSWEDAEARLRAPVVDG